MPGKIALFLLLCIGSLFAQSGDEGNTTETNSTEQNSTQMVRNSTVVELKERLEELNSQIGEDNRWIRKYANFQTYSEIESRIQEIDARISKLKKKKGEEYQEQVAALQRDRVTLKSQLKFLEEYKNNPFKDLIQPEEIKDIPEVNNPLQILSAFSFIKQLQQRREYFENNYKQLRNIKEIIEEKIDVLRKLNRLEDGKYAKKLQEARVLKSELDGVYNIFSTTLNVYRKQVDEVITSLGEQVKQQGVKGGYIGLIIIVLFIVSILIKLASKRYIQDNERLYTVNKFVNFINVTLIIIVILFAYLENVTYLVAVLGFASAGLAIAMKDLFMSLLGWIVIVIGSSVHVGDRIKVRKDGVVYVGDVLDISLLRITIHEDVTLTTYMENRRAGRIIFIPNNYIFTTLIANYTHGSMKTVWDGIDINITFASDQKKAMYLARDITKKYAKGYTDITRKQLNKLRDRYSLRNTNVEPKVFSFIEEYGVRVSVWYQTNSYATLTLRSTISSEILDAYRESEDIELAYPTSSVKMSGHLGRPPEIEDERV